MDSTNDDNDNDDSKIFPQRLMEILNDTLYEESICWLPHGRAFVICNRSLFAEQVMPRFFTRRAKYSSFTRKLNRWNFVRVSSGPEIGAYYHEFFLRDKPQLAAQMFCKNARSKAAMADNKPPFQEVKLMSQQVAAHRNTVQQQQPVLTLPPDIPLALLEALSKGPLEQQQQQQQQFAPQQVVPSRLLQQSQYATLLLERQIQLLQQEQAKRQFALQQQQQQQAHISSKPNAQSLAQMQQIVAARNNIQQKTSPSSHRAHAA